MTTGAAVGSLVTVETAVSVETAGASVVVSTGAEIGGWDASIELSLTRLVERVPQPPTTTPRTANTTRTRPTREIERTPSPLFLDSIAGFELSPLSLFAHGREPSVKTPVTPALFVRAPGVLAEPPWSGHAEVSRVQPWLIPCV